MEKGGSKQVKREKQERKVNFGMPTVLYPLHFNFL